LVEELALLDWLSLVSSVGICALLQQSVGHLVELRGGGLLEVSEHIVGARLSVWAWFLGEGVSPGFNYLLSWCLAGNGLGDLTTAEKSRLLILKLLTEADWSRRRLHSPSMRHIYS